MLAVAIKICDMEDKTRGSRKRGGPLYQGEKGRPTRQGTGSHPGESRRGPIYTC